MAVGWVGCTCAELRVVVWSCVWPYVVELWLLVGMEGRVPRCIIGASLVGGRLVVDWWLVGGRCLAVGWLLSDYWMVG